VKKRQPSPRVAPDHAALKAEVAAIEKAPKFDRANYQREYMRKWRARKPKGKL